MKRLVVLFIISLFLCIPAYAQGTKITLWHALGEKQDSILNELAGEYMEKHTSIGVEVKRFETSSELYSSLLDPKGQTLPDIAVIDSAWQKSLISADRLIATEDYMLPAVKVVAKMDTYKPLWKACLVEDTLWSMPYLTYNYALLYNEDLFKEKKIAKPPANWQDLLNIADKVSDTANGIYGFYIPQNGSDKEFAQFYKIFMLQAAPPEYNLEKDGFDGVHAEKALYFLYDLITVHMVSPKPDGNVEKYKSAMFLGTPSDIIASKDQGLNFKVVRWNIPNKNAGDVHVNSLAIIKKENAIPDYAWNFIYFLTEFKGLQKMTIESPYFPSNKQVTLSPDFFAYLERYPALRTFMAILDKSNVKPSIPHYENTMESLGKSIKEALSKKNSVTNSVTKAMEIVNKEINPEVTPLPPTGKHEVMEVKEIKPAAAAKPAAKPATKPAAKPAAKPAKK